MKNKRVSDMNYNRLNIGNTSVIERTENYPVFALTLACWKNQESLIAG